MSSFQDLGGFRSQFNPEAEAQRIFVHAALNDNLSIRVTPLGFYLRVIMNKKSLNLEKIIVLYLLFLINL